MGRPIDLPPAERFEHGTRSKYVCGCRCGACKASNRDYYRNRMAEMEAMADEVKPNPGPALFKTFTRTKPSGKYEVRGRACPGTGGQPCVKGGAWLKNKKPVCMACVERATVWNGLVDAAPAREHLKKLSAQGIGYKAVSAACDVASSCLTAILDGSLPKVRAHTLKKILAVDAGARADHSLVPSGPTWERIDALKKMGFHLRHISKELGNAWYAGVLAQSKKARRAMVTAKTANDIEKLYRRAVDGSFKPKSAYVDAGPTYEIIGKLLKSFDKRQLLKLTGYNVQKRVPKMVKPATAAVFAQLWAYVQFMRSGEPLPENWQWSGSSPLTENFGFEGGWHPERKTSRAAKKREAKELRKLARRKAV